MSLLEKTGYSYSGIADIIHNGGDTKALLQEIYTKHKECYEKEQQLQKEIDSLQTELKQAKVAKALCIASFAHAHKALKLEDNPLTFEVNENEIFIFQMYKGKDFLPNLEEMGDSKNIASYGTVKLTNL